MAFLACDLRSHGQHVVVFRISLRRNSASSCLSVENKSSSKAKIVNDKRKTTSDKPCTYISSYYQQYCSSPPSSAEEAQSRSRRCLLQLPATHWSVRTNSRPPMALPPMRQRDLP